jgi:Ca2+-binding EF-hand superfamily protein
MLIRQFVRLVACAGVVFLVAAACGGRPQLNGMRALPQIGETEQNIKLMLSYDENSDGIVMRQELEAGLRRQYATADLNHDGKLDVKEMQAENDRRFRAFGTEASPLIDWNQDGFIDFDEFASTARSVFEDMDKNHDGKLDKNELRLPQAGRGPIQPRPGDGRGGGR